MIPPIWLKALDDSDSQVREVVLFTLRGSVQEVEGEVLQTLFNSKHPEVRGFGAELLLVVDEKIAQEQFFDFLIDENSLVRATTLRVLALRKLGAWADLHVRSLQDDDIEIQRAAMDGLLSNLKEGVPLIQEFIKNFPAHEISVYLRSELQKNGVKP